MVNAGWVKLAAVVGLFLQLWGGTGLDRLRVCIRPSAEVSSVASGCAAGCCQRKAPERRPESKLATHEDGCCIEARLPDDPALQTVRDSDGLQHIIAVTPVCEALEMPTGGREAWTLPPRAPPRCDSGLASTRLRL